MKILTIARSNLSRFLRDRANIFFVFILPLGIVLLIGAQFGGETSRRLGVSMSDGDPVANAILDNLESGDRIRAIRFDTEAALLLAVERNTVSAGVAIPENASAQIADGENISVGFVSRPDGFGPQMRAIVDQAVATATSEAAAARFATDRGADPTAAAATAARLNGGTDTITIESSTTGDSLFEGVTGRFDVGASSQLVLFMFLTGLAGSAAIIQSRQLGVTRRMMSTPTSPATIVAGEALGRFMVVLVQGLYIVAATALLFGVSWGDPLGAASIILAFSAVGAGAALLFGTLFKNDQQAGSVGVIAGLGLAAIGGSMLPIELFSDTMRQIAKFTPHAWANEAFAELFRRNGTITDIGPQLGVLAIFAIVLLALATWRMRKVITAQ